MYQKYTSDSRPVAGIVRWRDSPLSPDRHGSHRRSETCMAIPLQDGTGFMRVVPCLAQRAMSRKLCSLRAVRVDGLCHPVSRLCCPPTACASGCHAWAGVAINRRLTHPICTVGPDVTARGLLGILVSVTGPRPARHQPHRVAAYGQPHLSRRHTILPHRTLLDQTRCSVPVGRATSEDKPAESACADGQTEQSALTPSNSAASQRPSPSSATNTLDSSEPVRRCSPTLD